MRRVFAVGLLFVVVSYAAAQERRQFVDEEAKLVALETAWNQAEAKKDSNAIKQLLSNTLIYIDYDGTMMTKAQFLASVKAAELTPDHIYNDGMRVHVYRDAAVVTGIYRQTGIRKGKKYSNRGRFTDMWVKENGIWLCVASQTTPILSR